MSSGGLMGGWGIGGLKVNSFGVSNSVMSKSPHRLCSVLSQTLLCNIF